MLVTSSQDSEWARLPGITQPARCRRETWVWHKIALLTLHTWVRLSWTMISPQDRALPSPPRRRATPQRLWGLTPPMSPRMQAPLSTPPGTFSFVVAASENPLRRVANTLFLAPRRDPFITPTQTLKATFCSPGSTTSMGPTDPRTSWMGKWGLDYPAKFSDAPTNTTRFPVRGPTRIRPRSSTTSTAPWIWTWGWTWQPTTTPVPFSVTWGNSASSRSSSASGSTPSSSATPKSVAIKLLAPCTSWSLTSQWSTSVVRSRPTTSASGRIAPGRANRSRQNTNWSTTFGCTLEKSLSPAPSLAAGRSSHGRKTWRYTRGRIQVIKIITIAQALFDIKLFYLNSKPGVGAVTERTRGFISLL